MNITEEYLKEHFITAYFVDNERTQITILSTDEETSKKVIETTIEYDMEHPWCQALFKIIDLDGLHETTYQKLQNERIEFEKMVVNIARKDGLIMESNRADTKFFNVLVGAIFNYEEEDKESLFALKIALFELDFIKDSKDKEKKAELRKAQTPIEVLQVAFSMK